MTIREEEIIVGPFDGPRLLVHEGNETIWHVTPARAAAEREAHARLVGHPVVGGPVEQRDSSLVFERSRVVHDVADAIDRLLPPERTVIDEETTARRFLETLGGPIDSARALGRAGLPRSRVDRFLDRPVAIRTSRGPDLGGVMPGAIRSSGGRLVAMSLRYGRREGWPVIDLASLALRAEVDGRAEHERAGGNDAAFDLALLHQALRELSAERDELRRTSLRSIVHAIVERVVPTEPDRVMLEVSAPSFLDVSHFGPVGDVESAHARRILRDWDGLGVGGTTVEVRTDPVLARPPRTYAFEPARERRRRLFSRFDQGVAFDDEGLFSATPEALADRIAAGLSGVVVDATCGIGSIALALARVPAVTRVIAIDRDPGRVRMAAHNARLYGVEDRIDFRVGDALALVPTLAFDVLVIDPPWGGRDYDRERMTLAELGMPLAPLLSRPEPVVLKLPRSFDVSELGAGFVVEPGIDARGVLKMLIARRGLHPRSR